MARFEIKSLTDRVKSLVTGAPQSLRDMGSSMNRPITAYRGTGDVQAQRQQLMQNVIRPTANNLYQGAMAGTRIMNPSLSYLQNPGQSVGQRNINSLKDYGSAAKGAATAAGLTNPAAMASFTALGTGLNSLFRKAQGQDITSATLFEDATSSLGRSIPIGGVSKFTQPLIGAGLNRLGGGAIAQRGAGSLANIAEGIGMDRATGLPTTSTSLAFDAIMGAISPGGGRLQAKGITKGALNEKDQVLSEAYSLMRNNQMLFEGRPLTIDDQYYRDNAEKAIREAYTQIFKPSKEVARKMPIGEIMKQIDLRYAERVLPKLDAIPPVKMGIKGADDAVDPLTQEARKGAADYRIQHQISSTNSRPASSLDNLDEVVQQHKVNNGYLTKYDHADLNKLKKMQGNPDAEIKIYRASPVNELNSGDWITTSKTYANDIRKQNGGKVYEHTVKVSDLLYPNDITELPSLARFSAFKYEPKSQLTDIWNKANQPAMKVKGGVYSERAQALKERELQENLDDAQSLMQASRDKVSALLEQIKGKGYKSDKEIPAPLKKQLDVAGAEWELNASKWQKLADERITQLKQSTTPAMGLSIKNVGVKATNKAGRYSFVDDNQISPAGRIKTAEIDNVYNKIPDGTTSPDGYIKKVGDKLYPTEKATPELLKNSFIDLNADGSIKEGFGLTRMSFTEDVALKGRADDFYKQVIEPQTTLKGNTGPMAQARQVGTQNQSGSKGGIKIGKISQGRQSPQNPGSSSSNTTPARTTIQDVERQIYGSETGATAKGDKTSVGFVSDNLRKLEKGASKLVSRGLESENKVIRNMAGLMQDLSGGAGKSTEQIEARAQYRGGIDYGTKVASDAQKQIYTLLGNNEKSLARVHAVLDPQISKIKVLEKDLSAPEREALGTLRILSDFVNDTNYKNGFISEGQWSANRGGKYIARAYEPFDYPPEVADFVKNKDVRFDLNPFKTRGEVTDWKVENAIKDPAYLMSKRVQQTMFNGEVMKYTQWASKSGLTSDVAKPGFVQLSDSKAYGEMAGKWIRKDALEDVKGFFLTHDVGQKAYEILSWYDRNPIRRSQKMLKTVFNPAVRLGNRTGNYVFAWLNGINPVSFAKNTHWANTAIKNNDPLYRYAMQNGLIGTDVTKADIAKVSAQLSREIQDPGLLKKVIQELQNSYGRVDDASKLASLKTWIDRGIDPAEAINRTRRGFQDYNMVGFLYDIGAKLPILGNPFVRFASESVRIAKNATVDHPLRTIGTIGAWALFADTMSRMQGETPQDKETREQRVGASHLPFTNISTNIQTPWGEANVSRLLGFSTTFTPEGAPYADISKYAPIQNPLDVRNYGSDPMIGPLISLATDKDFRGKSIADPNQSKYVGSTLTQEERNLNRAGHLARSYLPPTATDLYNVSSAVQGKPNVYGQVKSPLQAVARVYPGVKVEQYGAEEADAARKREAYFNTLKMKGIETKAKAIQKDLETGKITEEQAKKRNTEIIKELIPEPKFQNDKDAPKGVIDKFKLYIKAGGTDLPATLHAIRTGQPIRKVENDIVVLKRMKGLDKLDFGDKSTEVDHDVPLQYGGSNYDNTLPIADNKQKTIVQKKLYKEYDEGKITKTELNKRIDNWKAEVPSLTATEKKQAAALPDGKYYTYTDTSGKAQNLSIEPPTEPTYTGNEALDKKLKSKYSSAITTTGNNIIKLYEKGVLTASEAEEAMDKLANKTKSAKATTTKTKKAKKGKKLKLTFSKAKVGKIKKTTIKFGKLPSLKTKRRPSLSLKNLQLGDKERRIKA